MFDSGSYIDVIKTLLNAGYKTSINWSRYPKNNTLLIRHDVDFSVECALEMASLEINNCIKSSYFFMLTSNFYNILSKKNKRMVEEIQKMGHKVSIHFDPTVYDELDDFRVEKHTFESTFKTDVDIVSIHRPGSFLDNNDTKLVGTSHTYETKFFRKMSYISDSGGYDLKPKIQSLLKKNNGDNLQLLVHPIWWVDGKETVNKTLNRWREEHANFIKNEIRLNCLTYTE